MNTTKIYIDFIRDLYALTFHCYTFADESQEIIGLFTFVAISYIDNF